MNKVETTYERVQPATAGTDHVGLRGDGLSVVIPTYQRRDQTLRLIRSLEAELRSLTGCEVIVVADGSTDGTAEAVAALDYPVPIRCVQQPNKGLAAARNVGAREAARQTVLFLDDDLEATPELVATHLAAHRAAGRPVAVMGSYPMPDDIDLEQFALDAFNDGYERLRGVTELTDVEQFLAGNLSIPVAVVRAVGGFDENFVGWGPEDYDFGRRLVAAGIPILYRETALAWHRQNKPPTALCTDAFQSGRNSVVAAAKRWEVTARSRPPVSSMVALLWRAGLRHQAGWERLRDAGLALYRLRRRPRRSTRNPFLRLAISASRVAGCLSAPGGRDVLQARIDGR